MVANVAQLVGLTALAVGVFLQWGVSVGLIVAGVLSTLVGVALEKVTDAR